MNKLTYNNLYIYFTKIFLFITVCNKHNKNLTLIIFLALNTLDHPYLSIVINQVFNINPFINRIDLIKNNTFNYHLDNRNYNHSYNYYFYNYDLLTKD